VPSHPRSSIKNAIALEAIFVQDRVYFSRKDVEHVVLVKHPTVLTGSFNFTKAADQKNAENLLVIRDIRIAAQYEQNWQMHFSHSGILRGQMSSLAWIVWNRGQTSATVE